MNNNHAKASAKTISENDPIILEMLVSDYWECRCFVAKLGFHLGRLKDDIDWAVRREVARQGAYLDELKNDIDYDVRREVAYQGAFLDELKNDPDWRVRRAALEKLKELKEQEKWSAGC